MRTLIHTKVDDAIRHAVTLAPCGVGYLKGEGWFPYDLIQGCPAGSEPEFLILTQGKPPIPLTETATEVWCSLLRSKIVI